MGIRFANFIAKELNIMAKLIKVICSLNSIEKKVKGIIFNRQPFSSNYLSLEAPAKHAIW